jgi:hypothetical protein
LREVYYCAQFIVARSLLLRAALFLFCGLVFARSLFSFARTESIVARSLVFTRRLFSFARTEFIVARSQLGFARSLFSFARTEFIVARSLVFTRSLFSFARTEFIVARSQFSHAVYSVLRTLSLLLRAVS